MLYTNNMFHSLVYRCCWYNCSDSQLDTKIFLNVCVLPISVDYLIIISSKENTFSGLFLPSAPWCPPKAPHVCDWPKQMKNEKSDAMSQTLPIKGTENECT